MTLFEAFGLSDIGRVRARNEDSYAVLEEANLAVVADGMGGHGNGDVASRLAVEAIRERYGDSKGGAIDEFAIAERLQRAFAYAHEKIRAAGEEDHSLRGMGTTLVAAVIADHHAVIGHVGDSRAYALRDSTLMLLTEDHSWVHEQVAAGHLSEDQARDHPFKSVVTRALGGDSSVEVELRRVRLEDGDLLLLCSDGLTTMLTDAEIAEILNRGGDIQSRAQRLIDVSNERGGADNITVIVLAV
jgi:PPM family protein phosphatase